MNVLNTLFVLSPGAYVSRTTEPRGEGRWRGRMRVPIHGLASVVCFGHTMISQRPWGVASQRAFTSPSIPGRADSLHAWTGLVAESQPPASAASGNRARQHCSAIARSIVTGKIVNSRQVLLRRARETGDGERSSRLSAVADHLARLLPSLQVAESTDAIRGYEGDAAARYFSVFGDCISAEGFSFSTRSRRPPRDAVNALLSFSYAILLNDCVAALAGVGLEPDAGFLHRDRPGRPSLGLDLMEELRSVVADRLVLAMINRGQVHLMTSSRNRPAQCRSPNQHGASSWQATRLENKKKSTTRSSTERCHGR